MNLLKQAVEVRSQARAGRGGRGAGGGRGRAPVPSAPSEWLSVVCLLIPQMYVQHDIYDLIFKYVGTMEASEVCPKSPSSPLEAFYS